MTSEKPSLPNDAEPAMSFEASLTQLQKIVAELEDGKISLEESLQRFERGVGLLRSCYQILEQAEQKIEILTGFDANGNPLTAPFDASATVGQPDQAAGKRKTPTRRVPPARLEPEVSTDDAGNSASRLF